MKAKHVYITDLHFEHKLWKSQLEFQRGELVSFNKRLEEVVVRWTDKDILSNVEKYQNNFIIHNDVLDRLLHDIGIQENKLTNPVAIDHVHFDDHSEMRKAIETQLSIYDQLKKDFMRFLTVAM